MRIRLLVPFLALAALLHSPAEVPEPLTWERFTQTPEWCSAEEFSDFCREDELLSDPYNQSRALHGRGDEAVDREMERLGETYDLFWPEYKEFCADVYGTGHAWPMEGNGVPGGADSRELTPEELWDKLGEGPLFEHKGVPISDWYDTGAFYTGPANADLYYFPKGALYTYPRSLPESFQILESLEYTTSNGDPVVCVRTDAPEGMVLYESENGYALLVTHRGGGMAGIRAAADEIFFSRLR